jgi:hypothetical protein
MPDRRVHAQLKKRWDVPSNERRGGGEPANNRMAQKPGDSSHGREKEQPAHRPPTMQQGHHRRPQPNQRWRERHEQQMLNHVSGQHFAVERSNGRSYRDPSEKQAQTVASAAPSGDEL